MNKQTITASVLAVLIVGTLANAPKTHAFMGFFEDSNNNLIDSLVRKFSLKKDDVVTFFNQRREQNQNERLNVMQTKLNQLVIDKKLTEAQKNEWLELIKKHQEQMNKVSIENKDERESLRENHREEMQNFASKYNLDLHSLQMGREGKNMRRGK